MSIFQKITRIVFDDLKKMYTQYAEICQSICSTNKDTQHRLAKLDDTVMTSFLT